MPTSRRAASVSVSTAMVCALTVHGLNATAREGLQPAFDVEVARAILGHHTNFGACPGAPAPVADMSRFVSRYDPKDPTQSKVDLEREQLGKVRDDALQGFAKSLDHISDLAIVSDPANPAIAACVMRQLSTWARAKAMLANVEDNDRIGRHQAIMTQAWQAAAFASVVTRIGGFASSPGEDAEAVKLWFKTLAQSITQEYSEIAGWPRPENNHVYWAAYSVGTIGVLLNDRELYDFGRTWLLKALSDVAADGSLPKEMGRGERAFMYQQFATLPIAALVALNDRNGPPLNEEQENDFERLLRFNISSSSHIEQVEALSHAPQIPASHSYDFAWVDIGLAHVSKRNKALAHSMETIASAPNMRPAWHIWLGGNVSAAYNPKTLVKGP